ncbi:MAG: peptidase S41 [Xanthomonadales bacterium]|nr:peptidase S41 [Xanthomonadales bacterium]
MRRFAARCLIACLCGLPAALPARAQDAIATPAAATPAPVRLTAEQARRELRILKRALTDLHPGLYRYATPAELDAAFARADAEVADGSDALAMYRIASRLAAVVRCGHTWTNPLNQGAAVQAGLAALPALPLRLRLIDGRLLVTASADPAVPANAELLAIDGRPPAALASELLPYLRADGGNDGKRLSQLDSDENGGAMDRLFPLLHPPGPAGYALRFRPRGGRIAEATVAPMTAVAREQRLAAAGQAMPTDDWRLDIGDDGVAVMTLPTFAFWNGDFDWKGFLARSFDTLRERRIDRLVLDLRRNEGGDDAIGDTLQSYLLAAPFSIPAPRMESAYERVPYDLARFLDTWDFGFFDRTGQVTRGPGRNWILREQPADRRIVPAAQPFRGRVVLLTGPRMSSAGHLIARNLKASGSATLIGQPTGGNLRGLNGGQLAWLVLPVSGVSVDIPLIAGFPATPQPDSGVLPDLAVRTTLEDVAAGRDPDLRAARRWLSKAAR